MGHPWNKCMSSTICSEGGNKHLFGDLCCIFNLSYFSKQSHSFPYIYQYLCSSYNAHHFTGSQCREKEIR